MTMMTIARDSLLTLEAYAKARKELRAHIMPHRRLRSVHLGEHINLQFEDEATLRYQIQEMLRVEKIFDEAGIRDELEVYRALLPDGSNWKATMLVEYTDEEERKRELARLLDVEDRIWVRVAGHDKVYALADEDMSRETAEKTSAVHFLRFELAPAMAAAVKSGAAVTMGVDHPAYSAETDVPAATLAALAKDLA